MAAEVGDCSGFDSGCAKENIPWVKISMNNVMPMKFGNSLCQLNSNFLCHRLRKSRSRFREIIFNSETRPQNSGHRAEMRAVGLTRSVG
jgi:hypothetical protein